MDLHPGRNVYLTSWFILSVLFLTDGQISVGPTHGNTDPGRKVYLTRWLILSGDSRHLWSLHLSWIPRHMHLYLSRNIYLTSWFILSVLFLTGGETSVVPTHVRDLASH